MFRIRSRSRSGALSWYKSISYLLNNVSPSLIHDYTNDRYWNSATGAQAFPFTATRTSNATMFDGTGRLVWATANLFKNSDDFTSANWVKTAASIAVAPSQSPPYGTAYKLTEDNTTAAHLIQQSWGTWVLGQVYCISVLAKAAERSALNFTFNSTIFGAGQSCRFDLSSGTVTNAGSVVGTMTDKGGGWWLCSAVTGAVVSSGSNNMQFYLYNGGTSYAGDGTSGLYLAAPQIENYGPDSPKPWVLTGASAYYGPRLDYNPNGNTALGLLVEEARTNLCPDHLTVTATAASTATGTNFFGTASKQITWDGTSAAHSASYGSTASAPTGSSLHTISAYVRKVSGSGLIQLSGSANFIADTTNDYANFDLNNGTVVNGSSITDSAIVNCGNSIYRISMTFTTKAVPTAGASAILYAITSTANTRGPTNTSTDVFECFGAQFELGRGASSLVPTYGTSATRNADTFTTTSVSWLDQTKGTWYASVVPQNSISSARRVVSMTDGTANNSYSLIRATGRISQVRSVLSSTVDFSPSTVGTSNDFASSKMAMLLNSPTKKIVLNGGAVASSSVAFPTSGYTTLGVGIENASNAWQGWIKELRYYADASASNGQLQTLTT